MNTNSSVVMKVELNIFCRSFIESLQLLILMLCIPYHFEEKFEDIRLMKIYPAWVNLKILGWTYLNDLKSINF